VEEVELPGFSLFNACGRVIMMAEAYAIHEQDLRKRPREYGRYTYQRIMAAAGLSAADMVQAFRLRRELAESVDGSALRDFDALVTAVCLTPPARLGDFPLDWPPPAAATATLTIPFNVTGHPALAVPTGFYANGLPMGVQIVGRAFDEATVLRIGAAYESLTNLTARRPALGAH
jgi:aspartyl-tRNA(Asn)/glutamyl-tRNA(Gln) amidotransferase subunit A